MASAIAALAKELQEERQESIKWRCDDHTKACVLNKYRKANEALRRKLEDKLEQADVDDHRNKRLRMMDGQVKRLEWELKAANKESSRQWGQAQEQYKQAKVYEERLNDVQSDNEELTSRNLGLHHKLRNLQGQLQLVANNQALFTSSSSDF